MADRIPQPGDTSDEDDPVVSEIPVYHSSRLEGNLYLLDCPLKTVDTELGMKKVHFKPANGELKLELGLDVDSENFDTTRAEILAHEADGPPEKRKKDSDVCFENDLVDKVILTSNKAVKRPENYAVGVYNGKELHLTSLNAVLQLRPTFPHLAKALKRKKRKENDDGALSSDEEKDTKAAKQVSVKFKQNGERWKSANNSSFKSLEKKSANEKWVECKWNEIDSTYSKVEKLKLLAETLDETNQASALSGSDYVRLLVPEDEEQSTVEPSLPSHVMSLHALRALPLLEQCRLLLKDAQIIQFHQIMMLLAGCAGLTSDYLLKTLPKVAVLVRGNWVVKSEVLYPQNTFSATSGVPSEHMCQARDYVLYLFTKHQYVERKKVSSVMKIPAEEVKEIFIGISKLRHNKGWELKLGADNDFASKHSDILQRQSLLWDQRYIQLTDFLKDKKPRRKSKSVSEESGAAKRAYSSDNDSGTERKPSTPRKRSKKSSESATDVL